MSANHTPGIWRANGRDVLVDCGDHSLLVASAQRAADAKLIAAAPELLAELKAAHQIIRNALAIMTIKQKMECGGMNERDGLSNNGTTRANEREAVIAKAEGES